MATKYRVRHGIGTRELKLTVVRGDPPRVMPKGTVFDTPEFPEFTKSDWDKWETAGLIEPVDRLSDAKAKAFARQQRELARVRGEVSVGPVVSEEATAGPADVLSCPKCEFIAKTPHGLKVHAGRKHG